MHGLAVHLINKQDDAHADFEEMQDAYRLLLNEEDHSEEDTDTGTPDDQPDAGSDSGGVVPNVDTPDDLEEEPADTGPNCCDDPTLTGEAGEMYVTDDGRYIRLDAGDRICTNCDTVHENYE